MLAQFRFEVNQIYKSENLKTYILHYNINNNNISTEWINGQKREK